MELRIDLQAGGPIEFGRRTTGKTLGPGATAQQVTTVLHRALLEIERRESAPNTINEGRFVVIVQDPAILDPELRIQADTVNRRGAAVDVRVMVMPETPGAAPA
ncbi:hypothetical protein ACFWXO_05445 [Kitasatospora sp. NPDC059088]|uniref:hypothetical protein n=1 Tax=Kitasatospora sp. NPDC059088 TaxID=3346722 RepID=UPI0036BCFD47